MINEVDAQGKKRAEIAKRGPATAEPKLQTIKVKKDAPTQKIKNVAMVTQDEEERIKAEENMMEVGENENTIVKTPLDEKKAPRDDKTLPDVKIVINDSNKPGRVKLDKIIPRDKEGEGFLTPNDNAVLPSISVTPHLPKQEQQVIKGSIDDVVAQRKERADLAEVELALAEQALQIIKVRKALTEAIAARNSKRLIAITEVVRDKNYEFAMKDEMWKARNLIERLQHIRKLWHAVLELDHNTVAEVKGYAAPPPAVSKVLSATLLILGHYVEETKEWIKVQNILSRTGKASLLQRVGRFDIDKVDPGMAMGAKEILKDLTLQQVRVVSAGAATFYVWTKGLINEIETRMGEDILNTKPTTRRPRKNWELARSRALEKQGQLSSLISVEL
ncbi:uncharacterized protein [Haliotis cracherodii]|uniref:uncharacterized protein n=1 Tax=Haliotis cracherodii TaxID=6455 RepID=UPI0039EA597C